ncbi:MAG: twin-arginine translocation signal domain-containing protein [Pirellulales bacterium]
MSLSPSSRRQFLATAGGASATALFAPYFFSSQAVADTMRSPRRRMIAPWLAASAWEIAGMP